jgi:dienelactone hydrolase
LGSARRPAKGVLASSAEYAPIAPRLARAGFTVLAIDQRSGDGAFGGTNRTAAGLGRKATYEEALADLEAALAWAKANASGAPVVVWGSSYSAALVFLLAARHPGDVNGVVAFSPGEQQLLSKSNSTHGSSTLRVDANPAGAETHWMGVLTFLKRFLPA